MENKQSKLEMDDKFLKKYLPQTIYHNHSDIDLWINISIIQLLNYKNLLGEELIQFIQDNKRYNYNSNEEEINKEKINILKKISEGSNSYFEKLKKEKKNSILGFEFPECEIYFIIKLYVDDIERNPNYQTKIVFSYNNISQNIPFKFKYKDLTEESHIIIEIYSVELPPDKSFLGSSKIYLFDKNLNLYQGRHAIKINKNKINKEKEEYTLNEKEIDVLINSFYGKEFNNSGNYYGEGKEKNGIKIKDSKIKIEEIENNYYYNNEEKEAQIKTELMKNYDWKLKDLLSKTDNSFIIIKFPSCNYQVIYEEEIYDNYKNNNIDDEIDERKTNSWVYDSSLNNGIKDFMYKDYPITEKIFLFSKDDEISLNPEDRRKIEQLLNTPDFIELSSQNKEIFWKNRYVLLRNDTRYSLTKVINSVKWGDIKSEREFIKNILKNWKTIELCDILYMLSRKFSVNKIYNNDNITSNLTCMKMLRKFAVKNLSSHCMSEINFILLQLVQAIRYEDISIESYNSPLVSFLIMQCKKDLDFASSFYWFIECESQVDEYDINYKEKQMAIIYNLIKEFFKKEMKKNPIYLGIIENEIDFKDELKEISDSIKKIAYTDTRIKQLRNEIIDKEKKNFMHNEEHYCPIDPKIKIRGILTEKCTVFDSATKPIKYTFKITQDTKKYNHFKDNDFCNLFFKTGDDLRQDQLILQMINFMDSLFKKEQLDYEFTLYKVLATSKQDGFVEFVPNCKTYDNILANNNQLKSYFKDISDNQEMYDKKIDSFINSLAGYSAVNYILGIGDRHNENIMFDKKGRIFHIDFGYILGNDPFKYFPFKITEDMVICMGGRNSEKYKKFIQKCKNAYSVLRENARTIVNMFYLMIDSGIKEISNIECLNKLHDKFYPHLDKEQALNLFINDFEETLNSILPGYREKAHNFAKFWKY